MGRVEPRDHPKARPAGAGGDVIAPRVKEAAVTAEFVHRKSAYQRVIFGGEHGLRADDLRDHPAAVDIAHQHHRHAGGAGKAHIGNVARPQVRLSRGARALDHDQVAAIGQTVKGLQHRGHQAGFVAAKLPRLLLSRDFALHHHLRAGGALGF